MTGGWLDQTILRTASLVVPGDQRAEWLAGWRSELWYVPRRGAPRFCMGAFEDALWMRRNNPRPPKMTTRLESPASCIAFMTIPAGVAALLTFWLSAPLKLKPMFTHIGLRDWPIACVLALLATCLILPGALVAGRGISARRRPISHGRIARTLFLATKIVLLQPVLVCVFVLWILIAPVLPFALFGLFAVCIFALRWVLQDQSGRCPVCLRRLTRPVRIGSPSETFLDWYGAESTCSRGHGLLHVSETASSYAQGPRWLRLDRSWSSLFPAKGCQRDA